MSDQENDQISDQESVGKSSKSYGSSGDEVDSDEPSPKKRKLEDSVSREVLLNVLKKTVEMYQEHNRNSADGDRLFLLSLVQDFKELPSHRRSLVKIQILQILQQAIGDNDKDMSKVVKDSSINKPVNFSSEMAKAFGVNTASIQQQQDNDIKSKAIKDLPSTDKSVRPSAEVAEVLEENSNIPQKKEELVKPEN